jgi:predicted nucleic acid-binding protein
VIPVDTSIWVDHLRSGDKALAALLDNGQVAMHPFVIGELGLGALRQRDMILDRLHDLPRMPVATEAEMLRFTAVHALFQLGIGYVDAHLLAATRLADDATLWTRDKRLREAAERLALAADLPRG